MVAARRSGTASLAFLRVLLLLSFLGNLCLAFAPPKLHTDTNLHNYALHNYQSASSSSSLFAVEGTEAAQTLLDEISAMKVREIKAELRSYGIGSEDVFEKKDLVDRLLKVKRGEIHAASSMDCSGDGSYAPRRPNGASQQQQQQQQQQNNNDATATTATPGTDVPLEFFSLESFRSVDASNTGQSIYVRPSPGQFACIKAELPYNCKTLTLLVDTACSGVVLSPSSVSRLKIQTFKNAFGSMAAAGGNVANTAVAQLESLKIGAITTGAMPAAVQEIGALPSGIDGIIGLTFLNQYATVDMSFDKGRLQLYRRHMNPATPGLVELAKTKMKETRLKIYTAQVMLDGRGPVTMLVDTGAASSILNWRGLGQMGLNRNSPEISPTPTDIGAIGADNVALRLTHRYVLRQGFNLVDEENGRLPGVRLGSDSAFVNLDIGDIPVLESLASENVGGILGADLLMQSDLVRINFRGPVEGQLKLFGTAPDGVKISSELKNEAEPSASAASSYAADVNGDTTMRRRPKKKKVRSD